MLSLNQIKKVLEDQQSWLIPKAGEIDRQFLDHYKQTGQMIEIITGIRRCGKTTVLKQILAKRQVKPGFLNFEDPRLVGFDPTDFEKLLDQFDKDTEAFFFDEIQHAPEWERFLNLLHTQGKKVYATGSNASLLSKELGTKLTGRNIQHEMFPFSFGEFCRFTKQNAGLESLNDYLKRGGFPEFLSTDQAQILQQLFSEIIIRDIGVRFGIRNTQNLMQVALHLISNVGKEFSYNKIRHTFGIGSPTTVADYCTWLEQAYLFFYLPRFNWSPSRRMASAKKVYAIDNGMVRVNSLSLNEDAGRVLENAVFLNLRRQNKDLYYFREKRECDFLVFFKGKCEQAIQVCEEINSDTQTRELEGLKEAMTAFGLKKGTIVTRNQKDVLKPGDVVVELVPAWEFLI